MRLLIGAGGTGGGVYPALAVHKALAEQCSNLETLWVGSEGGMEADLVKRAGLPFRAIPAAGVHGVGLLRLPVNLLKLARGLVAARRLLRHFRPDVLFFTGGYVAVPIALAGRSIPKLLYVPDIEPGLALKTLARFADHIAVTVEESRAYFHHKPLTVSGYPTRPELGTWSRETARRHLRLRFDRPVLLVFGGSKGARALNRAILAHLSDLLEQTQVVHISGVLDWPEVEAKAQAISHPDYHPFPYLHEEMGAALAAADLALSRAGASVLGEYPLFGLPAILVPYPHAWRYQRLNAAYLERQGAALVLDEDRLMTDLVSVVTSLLRSPERLETMRTSVAALARPDAAATIARLLVALAGKEGRP